MANTKTDMKPFDFNKYIKNNPLLKEEVSSKEMRIVNYEIGGKNIDNSITNVGIDVDIDDGKVTKVNGEFENSGITSYGEEDFKKDLEPFKKAGVEVEYKPWKSQNGLDYEGEFKIDVDSLNSAIQKGKIELKADPEDPETFLIASFK